MKNLPTIEILRAKELEMSTTNRKLNKYVASQEIKTIDKINKLNYILENLEQSEKAIAKFYETIKAEAKKGNRPEMEFLSALSDYASMNHILKSNINHALKAFHGMKVEELLK